MTRCYDSIGQLLHDIQSVMMKSDKSTSRRSIFRCWSCSIAPGKREVATTSHEQGEAQGLSEGRSRETRA